MPLSGVLRVRRCFFDLGSLERASNRRWGLIGVKGAKGAGCRRGSGRGWREAVVVGARHCREADERDDVDNESGLREISEIRREPQTQTSSWLQGQ